MTDVTRADLREVEARISDQVGVGFRGIHERLDRLNGRVGKAEVSDGEHGARLVNLEREIFHRSRRAAALPPPEDRRPVTQRDVWLVGLGVGAGIGALKFIEWALHALRVVA